MKRPRKTVIRVKGGETELVESARAKRVKSGKTGHCRESWKMSNRGGVY